VNRTVIFRNEGAWKFEPQADVAFLASIARFVDLDLDGRLDVIAGDTPLDLTVFRNTGSTFTPALPTQNLGSLGTDPRLLDLSVADPDGDGTPEVLAHRTTTTQTFSGARGRTSATLPPVVAVTPEPTVAPTAQPSAAPAPCSHAKGRRASNRNRATSMNFLYKSRLICYSMRLFPFHETKK